MAVEGSSSTEATEGPLPAWRPPILRACKACQPQSVTVTCARKGAWQAGRGELDGAPPPGGELAQRRGMQSPRLPLGGGGKATAAEGAAAKPRHVVLGAEEKKVLHSGLVQSS